VIAAERQELTEQDRRAVLEVLEEASFRGESIEGIVHALDRRKNPPGIVEVRRAINWLVSRGLVTEDQEASPARFHRTRRAATDVA
jgi:Fe2+ or Zn2+ uptake regulation protein